MLKSISKGKRIHKYQLLCQTNAQNKGGLRKLGQKRSNCIEKHTLHLKVVLFYLCYFHVNAITIP